MRRALVFQHMDHDHPGRFADYLAEDNIIPHQIRLFEDQAIPSLTGYDLLFVLGGAQDTWQEEDFPWLKAEKQAIREWVSERAKPYFGVCLGHQLLADALGGEVALAAQREIGLHHVTLTEQGRTSPFMVDQADIQHVMQWHFAEVARAPATAKVLAESPTSKVQAMSIGSHALSTQYHCEFSPQTLLGWTSLPNYVAALEREFGPGGAETLITKAYSQMPTMARNTKLMWDKFKRTSGLVR
jgi:GMP synthase-like glutamine amidotransferase